MYTRHLNGCFFYLSDFMISIPFSGSKKYSYRNVRAIAEQNNYKTVYEPFGGSCLLSVNLLNDGLVDNAVVNDFDRFFDDYEDYLDLKDKVVAEGYKRGLKRTISSKSKSYRIEDNGSRTLLKTRVLHGIDRKVLQAIIEELVPEYYWRYFSLGCNFVHSAVCSHKTIKLNDFSQFNAYLKTDKQREYLEALHRCRVENLDWKDFLAKFDITPDDLVILDPPYFENNQDQYKGQFTLDDTKELIKAVSDLGCDFIFFNNNVETVKELTDGLDVSIELTGVENNSANRKRKDVMAFIKNRK